MNKTQKDLHALISSYSHLPKRILTQYAYDCALECRELMNQESRDCLEVVRLWLIGEATEEELREAGDKAYTSNYGTNAAAYAAYTVNAVNAAAYTAAYNAAYAAYYASVALNKPIDYYYDKFLNHINNLTALEKMLYLKEDKYE